MPRSRLLSAGPFLGLALLAPAPLLAACPETLAPGIALVFDDGTRSRLTPGAAPGTVIEQTRFDGGEDGYNAQGHHGLFDIEIIDVEGGRLVAESAEKSQYRAGTPEIPQEGTQGLVLEVDVGAGRDQFERRLVVSSGAYAPVDLGGCSYQAMPVTLEWNDPDEQSVSFHLYVPALGTAILIGYEDAEGRDDYRVESISVLAD
ncbi:MAG: hypothetical protein ACK4LQ_10355 [Pararhodobacter sp.]